MYFLASGTLALVFQGITARLRAESLMWVEGMRGGLLVDDPPSSEQNLIGP